MVRKCVEKKKNGKKEGSNGKLLLPSLGFTIIFFKKPLRFFGIESINAKLIFYFITDYLFLSVKSTKSQ